MQIENVLTPRNGDFGHGEEYLSDNAKNITDGGGIVISDVSDDSGIENKEVFDPTPDSLINKQGEMKNKLNNSSQSIVLESHL